MFGKIMPFSEALIVAIFHDFIIVKQNRICIFLLVFEVRSMKVDVDKLNNLILSFFGCCIYRCPVSHSLVLRGCISLRKNLLK
jgi:hypothetical protein